jgi:hypothetical protein
MIVAFYIECACPPDRREARVAGGDFDSIDDFLNNYQLTHIECRACGSYYQLIGYIDENGEERMVAPPVRTGLPARQRLLSSFRSKSLSR